MLPEVNAPLPKATRVILGPLSPTGSPDEGTGSVLAQIDPSSPTTMHVQTNARFLDANSETT
jgi:hypothetical protein